MSPDRRLIDQAEADRLIREHVQAEQGSGTRIDEFLDARIVDVALTVSAGMARFVIADISNPRSSPLELQATVPNYMIPFVPILQIEDEPFEMFKDLKHKYNDWVLDPLKYDSIENLLLVFEPAILAPALEKHAELTARKARELVTRDVRSYLPQNRKP
jgi:hypothetical protein